MIFRILARRSGATSIPVGWDDIFVSVAWVFTSPMTIIAGFLAKYGIGKDLWDSPLQHLPSFFTLVYVEGIIYAVATGLVKIAVLAFYLKIFPSQTFQRATWTIICLTTAWMIAITLVAIFQCTPVEFAWQQWDLAHKGKCVDYSAFVLSQASICLVLDLVIFLMPMPTLYRLQVSTRKKLQIMVMFSLGIIILVVNILRIRALTFNLDTYNPTWTAWAPILWSNVEIYVGITCACLPAAKVFIQHFLSPWIGPKLRDRGRTTTRPVRKQWPTSRSVILKRTSFSISSPHKNSENNAAQLPTWETGTDRSQRSNKLSLALIRGGTVKTAAQQQSETTTPSTAIREQDQA